MKQDVQKRCLTIQDYSCLGRCSLTVALPVISALGIETVGVPTALFSNHTAFPSWKMKDLADDVLPFIDQWKGYQTHFDCIYTGYLAEGQGKLVEEIFARLRKEDTLIVVDPAFADHGKIYSGFGRGHIDEMRRLCEQADLIVPNLTEACALLDLPYHGDRVSTIYAKDMVASLSHLGPRFVVLSGLTFQDTGEVGCAIFDRDRSQKFIYTTQDLGGTYHGAGDAFCSAIVGALLNGISIEKAVEIAHDFVHKSIQYNIQDGVDGFLYGLEFERALPNLIKDVTSEKRRSLMN